MPAKSEHTPRPAEPIPADSLASFTMQALVRQTGIAADTLRAWERRYGFPVPARTGGGHRLYTAQDVDAIRWVLQKQQEGLRARQAIELWQHQSGDPAAAPVAGSEPAHNHETLEGLRSAWVRACLALDDQSAVQVFNSAAAMLGPVTALLQVATAGLSQVGERWAAGTASVAQEHYSTAVAMRHVQSLLNAEPPPARSETVIVTCPEGEIHAYPSVVLTYLLRRAGWPVLFLDANLPARDLANTVTQEKPAFVLLCVQTVPALRALLAGAEVLSRLGMRFGFGGSVFLRYPSLIARVPGIYLGDRLTDTPDILQRAVNGTVQPNIVAPVDTAWRDMALALPEALIKVEADVVRQSEMLGLAREAVAAELELLRGYLLSIVTLGAAELLPGLWDWSDRMQKARGFDPAARAALLDTYRKSLRFHLSQPGPLAPAL